MHNRNSRRRKKRKGNWKYIWRKYGWNFPNLKDTDIKIQEAQRAPNKLNPNRPTPRCIIINGKIKIKRRLQRQQDKHKALIQGNSHKAISWFFCRNTAGQKRVARYSWSSKKEKFAARILYPARISFKIKEIKNFSNKTKTERGQQY